MKACTLAAVLLLAPMVLVAQQGADRSRPPSLGPAARLQLPTIQKLELRNGLDVWLVEAHEVPLVQVNLVVHAGSGDDPTSQFGLASLTAAMLDEGAGARSALEIADEVDFLGAELGATSSFDSSAVRLNVPKRALEPVPWPAIVKVYRLHSPRVAVIVATGSRLARSPAASTRP